MKITRSQLRRIIIKEFKSLAAEPDENKRWEDLDQIIAKIDGQIKRFSKAAAGTAASRQPSEPGDWIRTDTPQGRALKGLIGEIDDVIERLDEKKKKPKSRGDAVFPAKSPKVKDNKDHFPINSANQARNALARASQYSSAPGWYDGSLTDLVKTVQRKVKKKYKSIDTTSASANPGKG